MSRRRFFATLVATFLFGLVAVAVAPDLALVVLSIAVPISIAAATVSTLYLVRVFRRQPKPRSRFFRMLVETFGALIVVGAWVGYLAVARVTERAVAAGALDWSLPAPPPATTGPISALVVIVTFAAPVRYALEVYRVRRRATSPEALEREVELDRE